MSIRQRIASGLAANAFGQIVTVASQLLLTPFYFKHWGAAQYGEWLVLSSIPAYFSMADLGLGSAAGNEMTMKASAGDHEGAQRTFRSALHIAALAAWVVLCLGALAGLGIAQGWLVHTHAIDRHEAAWVVPLLAVQMSLGFVGGVLFAGFRCAGHNSLGITLGNLNRLVDMLAVATVLVQGASPIGVCSASIGVRVLIMVVQTVWLRRIGPWLHHPRVAADPTVFRRLIHPSIGFLAMPMAHALALQGPILVIGSVLGGPAVAAFSALRTLARLPIQASGVINNSVWPEISRAWGERNIAMVRLIHRRSWFLTAALTVCAGASLTFMGPWLMALWLHHPGLFDSNAMVLLLLASGAHAMWNVSGIVLAAINSHTRMGLTYVGLNALSLLLMFLMSGLGLDAMLICMGVLEVSMLLIVWPQVLHKTDESPRQFFHPFSRLIAR